MASERRPEYDTKEFRERYFRGDTLASIAEWIGVSKVAVFRAARRRGFPKRVWRKGLDR